ncbi:MAG: isocitrate lyase/PEP mutase family protein [Micromonosporaceae bacterium]
MTEELNDGAERLRALHHGERPLVLPNVWDAAGAAVVAGAGFPAVATTSAAVAESLGYPDHEGAPAEEMFAAAGRIAAAVDVPVTADVEAGYGLSPAELTRRLIEAGVVGCNLEDSDHWAGGLVRAETQANRVAALRSAATAAGVNLVINARVDVFVQEWGDPAERLAEAIRRGNLYLDAGADCVYPILAPDTETIGTLTAELKGPVNVLSRRGGPSLEELARLGVARVSYGSGIHRVAMRALRQVVATIAEGGDPFPR